MNVDNIIRELKLNYPRKRILVDDKDNPTEIICELESAGINPQRSVYIAVVNKKVEHIHRQAKETIKVLKGNLIVTVDGRERTLSPGQTVTIEPGQLHFTQGTSTWIKVTSVPGVVPKDHILLADNGE